MIPVELSKIIISENSNSQVIWLKETQGERSFPIIIGYPEAMAIERNIKKNHYARPLTHDLLANVIVKLGATLERVEVTQIKANTFYANLILKRNGTVVEMDCRPSDAIALGTSFDAPLFVAEEVIREVNAKNFGSPGNFPFPDNDPPDDQGSD